MMYDGRKIANLLLSDFDPRLPNHATVYEIRTGRSVQLFFEVPKYRRQAIGHRLGVAFACSLPRPSYAGANSPRRNLLP